MLKKTIKDVPAFTAGDDTHLREVLHPKNDPVPLNYSLAHATLQPGQASLPHRLLHRSETYIILKGAAVATVDEQEISLAAGEVLYIPAGARQSVRNVGAEVLEFLCIVDPPWAADEEEVLPENG